MRDRVDLAADTAPPCHPDHGRTIREAVMLALEALAGRPDEWISDDQRIAALRAHVFTWVRSYAEHRGVILSDADIGEDLDHVIATLRAS